MMERYDKSFVTFIERNVKLCFETNYVFSKNV